MACASVGTCGGITAQTSWVADRVKLPGRVTVTTRFNKINSAAAAIEVGKRKMTVGGVERFDGWMKESVGEIVKNLKEAPLLVHVYGGDEAERRLKTEKAVAAEWAQVKGKWVNGEEASPEGIILVEELMEEEEGNMGMYEENEGQNGNCTKAWGVLIQGKGDEGGVGCYLLKTSRVGCANLGLFATHYSLVKVKSFRESARSQLTSCWLS